MKIILKIYYLEKIEHHRPCFWKQVRMERLPAIFLAISFPHASPTSETEITRYVGSKIEMLPRRISHDKKKE
jgi:hypothetical protein